MKNKKIKTIITTITIIIMLSLINVEATTITEGTETKIANLNKGLVGHWTMSETDYHTGTQTLKDKTPYENHGTNTGATFTTNRHGKTNSAMNFGTASRIDTPFGNNYDVGSNDLSVSMWVKPDTTTGSQMFASFGTNTDGRRAYFAKHNSNWDIGIRTNAWGGGVTPVTTEWTMISIVFNSSENRASLYVNGIHSINKTYTSFLLLDNLKIGAYGNNAYQWFGAIDDVRLYNRALTGEEIKLLYESYNPEITTNLQKGLILHLPLNNKWMKSTTTLTDRLVGAGDVTINLSTPVSVAHGGTGRTSHTAYGLIAGGTSTTGAQQSLATGNAGQILRSGGSGAIPSWSTATYPSTATNTGRILRADGTNWVETTATYPNTISANQALYATSNNVIGAGTLPVAAGGTGATSFTAGRILFGDGTSAINTDSALHWDNPNKRLGIGTTAPQSKLHVDGTSGSPSTANSLMTLRSTDSNIGFQMGADSDRGWIRASDVLIEFTNWGILNLGDGFVGLGRGGAENQLYLNTTSGNVGIGTTTPETALQVDGGIRISNDEWISAVDSAGTGFVNMFKVNDNNQIEVGGTMNIGNFEFSPDSGMVSFVDMPVTSAPSVGTPQGYSFKVDGDNILVVYSEADGTGGIQSRRVGIGTINPQQALHVTGNVVFNGTINTDGNRIINIADGTAAQDAVTLSQLQSVNVTAEDAVPQTRNLEITGTADQISVDPTGPQDLSNDRQWTLSLPQNINTTSSPTFLGLTLSGLTQGSILFAGSNGLVSQNNGNLFWNNNNGRLGVGTDDPQQTLNVEGTFNATNQGGSIRVDDNGNVKIGI